jgi:hypothetical protein
MGVVWAERHYTAHVHISVNVGLVFATLMAATKISNSFPSGASSHSTGGTIRDLEAPAWLKTFFSNMQFHLTAICLVGVSRFSLNFMSVWIIQFTAFLMTLRRKNLAPHHFIVALYAAMLFTGFCVTTFDLVHEDCFFLCHILGNCGFLLRIGARWSKYSVWAVVCVVFLALTVCLVEVEVDGASLTVPHAAAYNSRLAWAAEDLVLPVLHASPLSVRSFVLASASSVRRLCTFVGSTFWDSAPNQAAACQHGQTWLMGFLFVASTASKMVLGRRVTASRAAQDAATAKEEKCE